MSMSSVQQHVRLEPSERAEYKRTLLRSAFHHAALAGQLRQITVGHVMSRSPVCVPPGTTAVELVEIFQERRFRHFLVVDRDKLLGVVSDRDVIRLFSTGDAGDNVGRNELERLTAGDLMSDGAVTVTPDCLLADAVTLLVDRRLHCLPVVQGDRPVGVLTSTDLFLSLEQLLAVLPLQTGVDF